MSTLQAMRPVQSKVLMPSIDLQRGATIEKRYRIERALASGGMATIYLAQDISLERSVAIKVLRSQVGKMPELVERFLNEARSLARLRSPYVAHVLDCGSIRQLSAPDVPYIVLELLDGVDLWAALQQNGRLSVPLTARYMLEACEGLAAAHALGIVHRDIKPENLFLAREADGTEKIKLLDFGISKSPAQSGVRRLTQMSEVVGSPLYMSPEQMRGMAVDARTDIWGLGAVMFECVAGRPVFDGSTVFEVSAQVLNAPLPDLRRLNPELPKEFVCVVEGCLDRNPAGRFQTVAELAQALEPLAALSNGSPAKRIARLLGTEPPEAPLKLSRRKPVRESGNAGKSTPRGNRGRHSRWGVGLSALLALFGILGFSGYKYPEKTVWLAGEARHHAASLFAAVAPVLAPSKIRVITRQCDSHGEAHQALAPR